jgi:hypothetical protein
MRRTAVKTAATLAAVLALGVLALGKDANKKGDDKKPKPEQKKVDPKLADLLAEAQKNSSDIRLAEAKLYLARTELEWARNQVLQKVVALYHEVEGAKAEVELYQADYDRLKELHARAAVSSSELRVPRRKMIRAKVNLATLRAKLNGYVGRSALKEPRIGRVVQRLRDWEMIDVLEQIRVKGPAVERRTVKGGMADKLRKALNVEFTVKFDNVTLGDILEFLENRAPGISFRLLPTDNEITGNIPISLRLKNKVPLGAVIQALQDTYPDLRFAVRDYGVLVTGKDRLPPDAVLLYDFWKNTARKKADQGASGKDDPGSAKGNPPSKNVRGTIKALDRENTLVTLSIGSDAGLKKGHTLEVFRLGDKNQGNVYLGRILILEVKAKAAVARRLGRVKGLIKVGDQVASKLTGR